MKWFATTLVLLSGLSTLQAQEVTPAIKGVVAAGTRIELIKEGFKGTEGPITLPDGSAIFTETQDNRITRIAADGSTSSYLENTSGADGLAVDAKGRLYVASSAGVQVFDSKGAALGVIALPKAPQNLAFAGPGKKVLYIVGRGSAWRINTQANGYAGRAK